MDKSRIKSIIKIDKQEAVCLYGKKGKNGALIITPCSSEVVD
jgi:hypothetical protein